MQQSIKFCLIFTLTTFFYSISNGQIARRGVTTNYTTTTSLAISKPTGVVQGDVLIATIAQSNNNSTAPTSAGWSLVDGRSLGSSGRYGAVYYKIATSSEPASYTFTLGTSSDAGSGSIVAFSGVDTLNGVKANGTAGGPFDVDPGTLLLNNSTSIGATSITTVTNNATILFCAIAVGSNVTFSGWSTTNIAASSFSEIFDVQNPTVSETNVAGAIATQTAAGASGAGAATLSTSERVGGLLIALKPLTTTLWATYNNNQVAAFTSTYSNGPASLFTAGFTGTTTSANTIGSLGRSQNPSSTLGNFYWITKATGNGGVIEVFGSTSNAISTARIGAVDINGASTADITYACMATDNAGFGWILASDEAKIYLSKFSIGSTLSATTFTTIDSDVSLIFGTVADFVSGDICITSDGIIYALANNGSTTKVFYATPNGANTTFIAKFNVTSLSGTPSGIAFEGNGGAFISTSAGLYSIPSAIFKGGGGTVSATQLWLGAGLTDLATNNNPLAAPIPVPVKMGEFTAKLQGAATELTWNTVTEINSHRFEIERSTDGVRFSTVGSVNAAGNSTDNLKYQFNDPINGLTGVVYYRLKSIDIDTKFEYSKIVAVRLNGAAIKEFSVYPNPCVDNMKISVSAASQTNATIRITNMAGQQVVSKNINLQQGENILVLTNEINTLKPGMHLLELISTDGVKSMKIIKK